MPSPQDNSAQARVWGQINHQLATLKLGQARTQMGYADRLPNEPQRNRWGQFVRWADIYAERANTWAETVYAIYSEVWEKQGKRKTPDFIRAVLERAVLPAIDMYIGSGKDHIDRAAARTRMSPSVAPILQGMTLKANRLKSEWARRMEIEAQEAELELQDLPAETQVRPNPPLADGCVNGPTAEQELRDFLSPLPIWQRKALECDFGSMTPEERQASLGPPATDAEYLETLKTHTRYIELVRRFPSKMRTLKRRIAKNFGSVLAPGRPGRPRKDELAENASRLKSQGKSWAQVARSLNTDKEAIRKLVKSRTPRPPEKTRT